VADEYRVKVVMKAGPFKTEEHTSVIRKADLQPALQMRAAAEKKQDSADEKE
jgi:hypothetical protein